jgi:hypothetical protein
MEALAETLATIRSTLPPRRNDGQPRNQLLPKRETALVELLEAMVEHTAIRDGLGAYSTHVCRGCSHDRMRGCPMEDVVNILYEMGRRPVI